MMATPGRELPDNSVLRPQPPVPADPQASAPPEAEGPAAVRCAAHPRTETYLRCGRCETPICPQCMIMTPVGARCRGCARLRKLPQFEVRPLDFLRGAIAGIGAATLGTILLQFVPGLGLFGFILTLGLGYLAGEATTAAARRKRGTPLAVVAALAVPLGLILGQVLVLLVLVGGARADLGAAIAIAAERLVIPLWNALLLLAAMAIAASRVR